MEPQKPLNPTPEDPQPQTGWPATPVAPESKWPEAPATPHMPASAPDPMAPTAAPVMGMTSGSKKKGWMIGAIVAAVILVLVGGGAAAYFGYYVPNKPENVLKAALANSFSKDKVQSMHFSGAFSIVGEENDQTLTFDYTGASSNTGAFELTGEFDAVVAKPTIELRSLDGKTLYLKVGGLSGVPELLTATGDSALGTLYGPIITALNDQWLEVNESLLKQFSSSSVAEPTLSDADLAKLAQAYDQYPFLVVQQKLADEKIKDVTSYHYKVVIDKTKLQGFAQAVKDANLSSLPLTAEQLNAFYEAMEGADFNKYPFDLWIAKDSKLMTQLTFKVSEAGTTGEFRFTVDSYNTPVKVEKPVGAKSILEVLSGLEGSSTNPASGSNLFMDDIESGISL